MKTEYSYWNFEGKKRPVVFVTLPYSKGEIKMALIADDNRHNDCSTDFWESDAGKQWAKESVFFPVKIGGSQKLELSQSYWDDDYKCMEHLPIFSYKNINAVNMRGKYNIDWLPIQDWLDIFSGTSWSFLSFKDSKVISKLSDSSEVTMNIVRDLTGNAVEIQSCLPPKLAKDVNLELLWVKQCMKEKANSKNQLRFFEFHGNIDNHSFTAFFQENSAV